MKRGKRLVSKKLYRLLKTVGVVGFSKKNNIHGINPIIISTAYIVLTLALASLSRKIVKLIFGDSPSILKQIILEFIATLELCAACFELIIVADNWGVFAYAVFLFLLTLWWSSKWENATACPYAPLEEVIEGLNKPTTAVFIVISQLIAALFTFQYVEILWDLELVETHMGKAYEECTADLQVDIISGALIEAAATCLCRLTSRILSETNAKFGNYLDAFFGTMMVVAAFNFTGGYFNPALATSLKFDCEGNTLVEHLVVYWLGATLGSILSVFIFKMERIQSYLEKFKPKED